MKAVVTLVGRSGVRKVAIGGSGSDGNHQIFAGELVESGENGGDVTGQVESFVCGEGAYVFMLDIKELSEIIGTVNGFSYARVELLAEAGTVAGGIAAGGNGVTAGEGYEGMVLLAAREYRIVDIP